MPWSLTQRDMEHFFGLTEVTMIRLPMTEWASPDELKQLEQIATTDPLPDDWAELQSKVARRSAGFAHWLRRLAAREWSPSDKDENVMSRLGHAAAACEQVHQPIARRLSHPGAIVRSRPDGGARPGRDPSARPPKHPPGLPGPCRRHGRHTRRVGCTNSVG